MTRQPIPDSPEISRRRRPPRERLPERTASAREFLHERAPGVLMFRQQPFELNWYPLARRDLGSKERPSWLEPPSMDDRVGGRIGSLGATPSTEEIPMNPQTAVDLCFTPATELRSLISRASGAPRPKRSRASSSSTTRPEAERGSRGAARRRATRGSRGGRSRRRARAAARRTVHDQGSRPDAGHADDARIEGARRPLLRLRVGAISRLREAGGIPIGKTTRRNSTPADDRERDLRANAQPLEPGAHARRLGAVARPPRRRRGRPPPPGERRRRLLPDSGSCCGVVGMKPSRGLVPWAPAAFEYWPGSPRTGRSHAPSAMPR